MLHQPFVRSIARAVLLLALLSGQLSVAAFVPTQAAGVGPARSPARVAAPDPPPDAPDVAPLPAQAAAPAAPTADTYWSSELVDPGTNVGRFTSLAIDSADRLHVGYQDAYHTALRYALFDGSSWITTTVDNSGNVGRHNSLDLDASEYPHVSYSESEAGLRHAAWDGSSWSYETVDDSADVGEYCSLAIGRTYDDVLIGYYDASHQSLKFARFYNSTWVSTTVDAGPGVGRHTALDARRFPYIAYYNATDDRLEYVAGTSSGWDFSNSPVNHSGDGGEYTSLAVDASLDPHISYFDGNGNALVYAHHNGTSWVNTVVDTVGASVTIHTAIVLDAQDEPHIAYTVDAGTGSLRYAYLDHGTWYTETVESGGVLGYPSIGFDSQGYPHVTYQATGGLKHARMQPTPDLIVTDIWSDASNQIGYQVRNVGPGVAPAGHQVQLEIDSVVSGVSTVDVELAPGERYDGVITTWSCSETHDTLSVTADYGGIVVEVDEGNNERQETWDCDTQAPHVTWGPTATLVLTDSVVIEWGTDENSDSWVYYDESASGYSHVEFDEGTVTAHQMTLSGLTPATVYRYAVESNDPRGNGVTSGEHFFETAALPSDPLTGTLSVARSSDDYEIYSVAVVISPTAPLDRARDAAMKDIVTPDHVEFFVNDQFIGATYSGSETGDGQLQYTIDFHPHNVGFTRTTWERTTHVFKAYVVREDRIVGMPVTGEFAPVSVGYTADAVIHMPPNDSVYYTDEGGELPPGATIPFSIRAVQYEWLCDPIGGVDFIDRAPDCESVIEEVAAVEFYVDDQLVYTSTSSMLHHIHAFQYDAEGMSVGTHTLRGVAITSDGQRYNSNVHTISVEHGTPSLDVERTVTRNGNFFEVALTISLDADASGPAFLYSLEDYATEMMPVQQETPTYTLSSKYPVFLWAGERTAIITIDFETDTEDWIRLDPGHSYTVVYQVVPILYENGPADPVIGKWDVTIDYFQSGETIERDFDLTWSIIDMGSAVGTSDYILVTNPHRLYTLYDAHEKYDLLSSMAHLATLRNGVLGFLDTYVGTYANGSNDRLDDLVEPGGYWAEALHPNFLDTTGGYLLIVGETEVVPAWDSHNFDICWSIPGDDWHCRVGDNDVFHHDQWYANLSGSGKPELNVGRIIGDTAWQLERPLIVSIGVHEGDPDLNFQAPGRALLVSGRGRGQSTFENNIDLIDMVLDDDWIVEELNLPENYPDLAMQSAIADGVSLIHLIGHGNVNGWGDGALSSINPPDFYRYCPFIFAATCLTGNYEAGDDYNLAESLFEQGISVYVGATQVSPIQRNADLGLAFYVHDWNWDSGEAIGRAFSQLERDFYDDWAWYDWYHFWVFEYNLYGDPKFGASDPTPLAHVIPEMTTAPTTTLHVQVPGYVVTTTVDGFDHVEIPGGRTLLEGGLHEIPYWSVSVNYPAGYRVQDVDLTTRAGYAFTTGLNLPTAVMTYYTSAPSSGGPTQTLPVTEDDDWLLALDEVYEWRVSQNPDGSSVLDIRIFPFHYQPATTHVEWYDDFTFDVEVISTSVTIDGFHLENGTYAPGEGVWADMWIENPGDEQDLIVAPTVRNLISGEVVDGLGLRTLHDVFGPSHYGFEWDSTGFASGEYMLWVELLDGEGNVLDSAGERFQLGGAFAELADFSVTPDFFQPGDAIDVSMTISNTGFVPLSGEAHIHVQTAGGVTTTAVFTHTVSDLAPGSTLTFEDVWDTASAAPGDYRILGYFKYGSRTTEVETREVTTLRRVYLPLVLRESP